MVVCSALGERMIRTFDVWVCPAAAKSEKTIWSRGKGWPPRMYPRDSSRFPSRLVSTPIRSRLVCFFLPMGGRNIRWIAT